jgi:hypothetical protein
MGDNPWGIFLIEFKHADAFTTGRGMTGPLRRILRGLVPSKRWRSTLASFKREHLLFICTHAFEHYRFAYFKAPPKATATAPLAAFGWGPGDPIRTLCEFNLPELAWPHPTPAHDEWIAAWVRAFDVEKVTKRFYQDYADVFESVEQAIGRANKLGDEELRLFTQTLFNRLMFLRFIERKGWLEFDGRHDYLRMLFAAPAIRGKSFYTGRLQPLFFKGLAIEGEQESDAIGRVPFLNGGLFESTELDAKVKDIPNTAFDKIIGAGGLFYRYNFTVEESTPLDIEVAVDPEMLGKVFEELVTGRHESGSYYTPRPIVSFMCREALKGFLGERSNAPSEAIAALVDEHEVRKLKETQAREILAALDDLKAVDPACGSGAYLLGLMQEMIALYRLLYSERIIKDSRSLYELKLRIISQNLYGVDIDQFATNIAMLRLWLSLAVEVDEPVPLPNLDFKIETGDSLLAPDPHEMPDLFRARLQQSADVLAMVKRQFFLSHGEKKESYRRTIVTEEARLRRELAAEYGAGIVDWRIQFAEAFANRRGGFDFVLANPPYIDSERMTRSMPDVREHLQEEYSFTKGNWDVYIAFFERGFQLLNPKGVLSFITPDKWISKPFGEAMRLATNDRIVSILNAGRTIFEKAKVDAIVTVYRNTPQNYIKVSEYDEGDVVLKRTVEKSEIKPPYAYDLLFAENIGLLSKLSEAPFRLTWYGLCENACATSDAYKLKEFIQEEPRGGSEANYLRIINTGTIGKYVSRWGERQMVYLGSRLLRPVVNRKRFAEAFPNSYGKKAVKPKIIMKGLNLLDACLDAEGTVIPGKTTLIVTSDSIDNLKLLLCIINSSVTYFYIKQKYPASSYNQGTTFTKDMLNELPIPEISAADRRGLVQRVDAIVNAKRLDANADVDNLEAEIDQLVCKAFQLSPGEVLVVKGDVS